MELTAADIKQCQQALGFANKAYINSSWQAAQSGKTFDCISPIDGRVLTQIPACDTADIDLAVASAKACFERGDWAKQSPRQRKRALLKLADLINEHQLELALLECLDMGKPISDAYTSDIPGAAAACRWIAEAIDKVYDLVAPTAHDVFATIRREPCGVVGIITPWNFPFYLAVKKLAPALAAGNSVVMKPAEQSPLSTLKLAQLIDQAGFPEGVVNVVPGFGETAGKALALHCDVDVVSFTGSTEVGRLMMQYSGQSNLKRIHLECGGKSPNVICADAPDLTRAAIDSAMAVFTNSGQICCAPTRLLVDNRVREQVMQAMQCVIEAYQPGNPLDPDTKMGAMVDRGQCERVMQYIGLGKQTARLVCGGEQMHKDTGGYYIQPTIFDQVSNDMIIAREEIFGPVLSVIGFDNEAQAIQIANDSDYGLAASVWTSNISKAHQLSRAIRAGVVSVNTLDTGDSTVTFGGYKQSGIGTEGALYDFDNYSEIKSTWMQL